MDSFLSEGVINGEDSSDEGKVCSIWFPEAPKGYLSMGCVVSSGRKEPPASSAHCILASLVSPCGLRDCINISLNSWYVKVLISVYILCIEATISSMWHLFIRQMHCMLLFVVLNMPLILLNIIMPCEELCLVLIVHCNWILHV